GGRRAVFVVDGVGDDSTCICQGRAGLGDGQVGTAGKRAGLLELDDAISTTGFELQVRSGKQMRSGREPGPQRNNAVVTLVEVIGEGVGPDIDADGGGQRGAGG